MLRFPENGLLRSINVHNSDVDVLCDWIEANALFDHSISKSDAVDALIENQIYVKSDFAYEIIGTTWNELRRRSNWLQEGSYLRVDQNSVGTPATSWQEMPVAAFCLVVVTKRFYSGWDLTDNGSFIEQGDLFESIVKESLSAHGWQVHRTGWASGKSQAEFRNMVSSVADSLQESFISQAIVNLFHERGQKEMGLDLVCTREFVDRNERCGMPAFFIQCASGEDWKDKLKTPDMEKWTAAITFSSAPKKGFATPRTFHDNMEFWIHTNDIQGPLLDRIRILSAGKAGKDWVSPTLKQRLITWLTPRIDCIPKS